MNPQDHRILRARERYGVILGEDELAELTRQVSAKNCMKRQVGGAIHVLLHEGVALVAAVEGGTIRTFLPPDYFQAGRNSFREWARLSPSEQRERRRKRRPLA